MAHEKRDIYAPSPSVQTANPESNVMSFLNIFLRAKLWFVIFATDNLLMQKRFDNIKLLVVLHSPNSPLQKLQKVLQPRFRDFKPKSLPLAQYSEASMPSENAVETTPAAESTPSNYAEGKEPV
ncbi:unnamed protein product [Penicillium discolor]